MARFDLGGGGAAEPAADTTSEVLAALRQLSADVRAVVVVMAGVGAVATDADDEARETLTRSALALFDRMRRLRVDDGARVKIGEVDDG